MKLGIFLPTYKRSYKLQDVANNIEQTTKCKFKLYFGCEANDSESIEAAKATGHQVVVNKYDPAFGYSNTIQSIYEIAKVDIIFHANDDFEFLDGWDTAPLKFLEDNPKIMVLGAHDGTDNPSYSTISFIRREYIERMSGVVDTPNRVFYPYHHNYQDTELTQTAQARGVWEKIETPCIKHHRVGGDETYSKNDATSSEDGRIFASREHLWKNISKEDIMTRKPMTEEQRQAATKQAKARWAKKKASSEVTEQLKVEKDAGDTRPTVNSTDHISMVERALDHVKEARKAMHTIRQNYPDMIEATQTVDALDEATARMGQTQGLVARK